jgi:hypothetical protein
VEPISYPVFQRNAKRTVHERCVLAVSLAGAPQSDILAANKFHGAFASCAGYLLATGNVFAQVPTSPRTFPPPEKDLLAADGTWLPYVNQENGKVLDLKSDPPKVLATLGDAYALALSPDKS